MVRSRITVGTTPEGDGGLDLRAVRTRGGSIQNCNQFACKIHGLSGVGRKLDVPLVELIISSVAQGVQNPHFTGDMGHLGVSRVVEAFLDFAMCRRSSADPKS